MDTEIAASSGPAEVYEPVQTLNFWPEGTLPGVLFWVIEKESGTQHEVDEIYCNVPTATRIDKKANPPCFLVAVGRLTISGGVAYVDEG